MEIRRFLRAVVRHWYLIVIPLALVGAYSAFSLAQQPTASTGYVTEIRFSAAQSIDAIPNRDGDFQDVWLSSELTVNALTSWARTSSFQVEVANRAAENGVTFDAQALPVAADQDRSIGQLILVWPNATELEVIAQAALTVLREDSQRYFPQFGNQPARVTILDEIRINAQPAPIVDVVEPLILIALAFVGGFGLAVLAETLDPTLHNPEDATLIGFDVIASIPDND